MADKIYDAIELKYGSGTLKDGMINISNLRDWANYIRGARVATRMIFKHFYLSSKHDEKIYDKAMFDLISSDPHNMDRFLCEERIMFTDHIKDKKGRLIKCRAYFAIPTIQYTETQNTF